MTQRSYRMLQIGGAPAGLIGLDELFEALYDEGCQPSDEDIAQRLIKGVRQHNFIPKPALSDYKTVLMREYQQYHQQRSGGEPTAPRDYGQWQGIPREQIPWFPTVSAELCNGCGNCFEICPKDVFVMDEAGKAVVVEPFLCIVGCCLCKGVCDPAAILMPEKSMLDTYRHGQRPAR